MLQNRFLFSRISLRSILGRCAGIFTLLGGGHLGLTALVDGIGAVRDKLFSPPRPWKVGPPMGGVAMIGLITLLDVIPLNADTHIKGRVVDDGGEGIFAANVFLRPNLRVATATNFDGTFELFVPDASSKDTLVVSFIGYATRYLPLATIDTSHLYITLKDDNRLLNAVLVESQPEAAEEFSIEKLERLDVYLSPIANGDALNAITFLPASTNTDESANPTFRGSNATASQVLLNGIPIANPVRNTEINGMGNFSLFNTSLIDNLTVYAGNPPLSKSNATSGVTDIHTASKIESSSTELSLSLANIGVLRSQKLGKDPQGRCFIQGYTNWQFHEPYTTLNNAEGQIESFRSNDAGLNFHFGGKPVEGNVYAYFIDESFQGASYIDHARRGTSATNRRGFAVANIKGINGRLAYDISMGADISDGSYATDTTRASFIDGQETDHRFHLNATLKHYVNNRLWIDGGLSTDYAKLDMTCLRPVNPYKMSGSTAMLHTDTTLKQLTPELFLYARYEVLDGLVLGGGIRGDLCGLNAFKWVQTTDCHSTISWQANAKYSYGNHSFLLSGGMYHGHLSPTLYIPQFTSSKSLQASLEYGYDNTDTHIEATLYGKRELGTEYINYRSQTFEDERHIAGAEVSSKQDIGHLRLGLSYTCLISYTYLDSKLYKSSNHLPWWVKGSLQYIADDGFTFALNAQARPGTRYTPIIEGIWDEATQQYCPVFGEHNSAQLNPYCRFDLSLNKLLSIGKRGQCVLFATLTNIFNRSNEAGPIYKYDYSATSGSYCLQPYTIYFGTEVAF